jgi:hypothetical protein
LEELGALFNPGMRHEQERREKLAVLREDEGNSADPPSTVDLDLGVAILRRPKPKAQPGADGKPAKPAAPAPAPEPDAADAGDPPATPAS